MRFIQFIRRLNGVLLVLAAAYLLGLFLLGTHRISAVDPAQMKMFASGTRRGVGTDLPIGKGAGTKSDIDYIAPPSSLPYFEGLQGKLPSVDPKTGIIPGTANPNIGPSIRFEPK